MHRGGFCILVHLNANWKHPLTQLKDTSKKYKNRFWGLFENTMQISKLRHGCFLLKSTVNRVHFQRTMFACLALRLFDLSEIQRSLQAEVNTKTDSLLLLCTMRDWPPLNHVSHKISRVILWTFTVPLCVVQTYIGVVVHCCDSLLVQTFK